MKVISWNANCKFREKYHLLSDFDIAVVQECEDPARCNDLGYKSWASNHYWIGDLKHKGLGVFPSASLSAQVMELPETSQRFFLPIQLSNGTQLLAVWAMGAVNRQDGYVAQIHDYLRSHSHYFDWEQLIIVGDFNSNAQWDAKRQFRNHGNLVQKLNDYGSQSLYHHQSGELHGAETSATFFMYRHADKPYHIDYVFVPDSQLSSSRIELGEANDWLQHSDHVPLFADLT
jgi:endonuclease/exonuclease/phosphatase family metal-dependent hydrolase